MQGKLCARVYEREGGKGREKESGKWLGFDYKMYF